MTMRRVFIGAVLAFTSRNMAEPEALMEKVMGKAFIPAVTKPQRASDWSVHIEAPVAVVHPTPVTDFPSSKPEKSLSHLRVEIFKLEEKHDRMKAELEAFQSQTAITEAPQAQAMSMDAQSWRTMFSGFRCLGYGVGAVFVLSIIYKLFVKKNCRDPIISTDLLDGAELQSSAATSLPSFSPNGGLRTAGVFMRKTREPEPEWLDDLLDWSDDAGTDAAVRSKPRRRADGKRTTSKPKLAKEAKRRVACYGCGADLQMESPAAAGYVEKERYELKAMHRQLKLLLCTRCRSLAQGEILPAVVEGRLRKLPTPTSELDADSPAVGVTTPEQLRAELSVIRQVKCLVVLLVDLTDVTGSFLPRVRDLVGGNPIVLIGTKADLLPKGTDDPVVEAWLLERLSPRLNIVGCHLTSSRTGSGINAAVRTILGERQGRDLFIIGAANVGKSRFVGSLLEEAFGGRTKRLPLSSATPGTTLRMIAVDCFDGASMLFDTPGVHLAHRLSALLLPAELKAVIPRGRIIPYTPPVKASPIGGSSFFWGGLARIDVLEGPVCMRLSFVTAYRLRVTHCENTEQAEDMYASEVGVSLTPPLDPTSAAELGGLELRQTIELELTEMTQTADVCISGLGWVSVGALTSLRSKPGSNLSTKLAVWVPKGVMVSLRPPMPVAGLPNLPNKVEAA